MQLLFFIFFYPLIWFISILPFRLLYLLSDFIYVIVYKVIGYRKAVVRHNLKLAFPEKSDAERLMIEKKSYHHLCDIFMEMIKTMSISEKEIKKRFKFTNMDFYLDMEKRGKSIAMFCSHYASYEWLISMNYYTNFKGFAIYKKIANPYFDKQVRAIRSKFKAFLITTKDTYPTIVANEKEGIRAVYGFASDQSPKASKIAHWTTFLGVDTPIHTGAETIAKKFDMNVIFLKVKKVKRGYYEATFEELTENPRQVPDFEISDEFMTRVEKQIIAAPEFYLWTHKRWKTSRASLNS